jgi:hypothetical protein
VRRTDPKPRVVSALSSSVRAMRGRVPKPEEISILAFADLFPWRAYAGGVEAAEQSAGGRAQDTEYGATVEDLADGLLRGWWLTAARIGQCVSPAGLKVEDPARALGGSAYFGLPELAAAEARALSRYLTDSKLRHEARDRTQSAILPETRVVVGHGLGALIAYEALCVLGDAASVVFVSLGASLCGPDQIFDRLEPAPRNEQGHWPAAVRRWFNVVAHTDPTAMVAPELTERFGPGIEDEVIEIKSACGDLSPYLLDRVTGRALIAGLGGTGSLDK